MKILVAIVILLALVIVYRGAIFSDDTQETAQDIQPAEQSSAGNTAQPVSDDIAELPTKIQPIESTTNAAAKEIGLVTDPDLIAEIERDMQFSPAPEGDVSYMSPEAETVQINEPFPGEKPDPTLTMPGNNIIYADSPEHEIGKPLDPKTKMDDNGK